MMPLDIKIEHTPSVTYTPIEKKEEIFKSHIQKPKRKQKSQLQILPIKLS